MLRKATPGQPATSRNTMDIRMFNDIHYFGLVSQKVCVIENKFPTGKGKYEYINVGWYSAEYEHMSQIPCIVQPKSYTVTTPFNKRGRQTIIKIFGNTFMMFEGYMARQTMPIEVTQKRQAIMFETLDDRMDRSLSVVENASTKFFSVEGMLLLFWQLRYIDSTTGEECIMGEIPDITSLSDVDVHNYMRVHLLNGTSDSVQYFDREIAKVSFSPARSVVLTSFYDINETSFVNKMSLVVDKIAYNDSFIVSKRQLPHSEVTPTSGYCLPDGTEYVVWRRNNLSTENSFANSGLCVDLMNKLLDNNVELFPVKPFIFSHHADGNHFMVVYHHNVYMPKCKIKCLTTTTLSIMKQASRALDDYAYYGSPGSYRVVKTMEHFRYLYQVHQYIRYLDDAKIDVTLEIRALCILQAAVLLAFARPERRFDAVYKVLDSFCDTRIATDSDLISMSQRTSSEVYVKRSKCDGETYFGRVRTYNGGKYAIWNDYMSTDGLRLVNNADIRMAKLLPQLFEVSEPTLLMIEVVCKISENFEHLTSVSRSINMSSPYDMERDEQVMAFADNATIIMDELAVERSPLSAGHRRKITLSPTRQTQRIDLVDEDCNFIDETDVMRKIKPTPSMARPMSFWAKQQRQIVAEQVKSDKVGNEIVIDKRFVQNTLRPKCKVTEQQLRAAEIIRNALAKPQDEGPCPQMVAAWTELPVPDEDGDIFYNSSDELASDNAKTSASENEPSEDEALYERIKWL
jgi:hypothetical protein